MPREDCLVHLSSSAPFEIERGELVFYDVVETDVISRSSVLSCVVEGGGEAELRVSVTASQFRLWLTAVAESDAEFRRRSFVSMCTIIKVPPSPLSTPADTCSKR